MRLLTLPQYLKKWLEPRGFSYQLVSGWDTRSRSSGDFTQLMALGVHHAADNIATTVEGTINWCCYNSTSKPIGNGCVTRTKYGPRVVLWAVRATNTQGTGGPVLTSSGTVPLNAGNTRFFSWEAMNNGVGETWDDAMCDCYVLACCAVIDCARGYGINMGVGDIFAHFEWTNPTNPYGPTRKPDPAGPCRWNGHQNRKWDMNMFRGEVFQTLMGATTPPSTGTGKYTVVSGDSWWKISQKYGITVDQLVAMNPPATSSTVIHPGDVLNVPGATTPPPVKPPTTSPVAPNGLTAAQNQADGAKAATPPASPMIYNSLIHNNCPWLQQVLCSMKTLPADGAKPIFPPEWVGEGRIGSGPATFKMFGDAGRDALAYWQSKNGLTADGKFGNATYSKMRAVRGK